MALPQPDELPTSDEEVWRYSRIAELDLRDLVVAASPGAPRTDDAVLDGARTWAAEATSLVGEPAVTVSCVDGQVVDVRLAEGVEAAGVRVDILAGGPERPVAPERLVERLDVFDDLSEHLGAATIVIEVSDGVVVSGPILVVDVVGTAGLVTLPRLVVRAGARSEVSVVEWQRSTEVAGLCLPLTVVEVGAGANVDHLVVQERGARLWQLGRTASVVHRDATYRSAELALGGDYARRRTDCRLVERGATGNLAAAFLGHRTQMLDFRTFQRHEAPDTTSNLLFTGALAGSARSVYSGLIRVEREARGTNAFQTNRNLKLSDRAWAESVPNLEIENNDVRCSHASTVAPVDEDQRFYLESRGVPPAVAERLLAVGFFDEVLGEVRIEAVRERAHRKIAERVIAALDDEQAEARP